jgi:hypothetical protein
MRRARGRGRWRRNGLEKKEARGIGIYVGESGRKGIAAGGGGRERYFMVRAARKGVRASERVGEKIARGARGGQVCAPPRTSAHLRAPPRTAAHIRKSGHGKKVRDGRGGVAGGGRRASAEATEATEATEAAAAAAAATSGGGEGRQLPRRDTTRVKGSSGGLEVHFIFMQLLISGLEGERRWDG